MTWHQADLAMIRGEVITRPGTDPRYPITLRYRGMFLEHHDGTGWVPCSYRRNDREDREATDWQIVKQEESE